MQERTKAPMSHGFALKLVRLFACVRKYVFTLSCVKNVWKYTAPRVAKYTKYWYLAGQFGRQRAGPLPTTAAPGR